MAADLATIELDIRACIVSCKEPLSIQNLSDDYENLVGSKIPFLQLSYATLEEFLRSLPSLSVSGKGSQATVKAASSGASKHITELVSKQKPAKPKKILPQRPGKFNSTSSLPRPTQGHIGNTKRRLSGNSFGKNYHKPTKDYNGNDKKDFGKENYLNGPSTKRDFDKENYFNGQSLKRFRGGRYSPNEYDTKPIMRENQHLRDYPARNKSMNDYHTRENPSNGYQAKSKYENDFQGRGEYQARRKYSNDYRGGEYMSQYRGRDEYINEYQAKDKCMNNYQNRDQYMNDYEGRDKFLNHYQGRDQYMGDIRGRDKYMNEYQANDKRMNSYQANNKRMNSYQGRDQYMDDFQARDQSSKNYLHRGDAISRRHSIGGARLARNVECEDRKVLWNPRDRGISITISNF